MRQQADLLLLTGQGESPPTPVSPPFPMSVFLGKAGQGWDPYHPGCNTDGNGEAGFPAIGDLMGRLASQGDNSSVTNTVYMDQVVTGQKPIVVERAGRRGMQFDGVGQHLKNPDYTMPEIATNLPAVHTHFAAFYLEETPVVDGVIFAQSRNSSNLSYIRMLRVNYAGALSVVRFAGGASGFFNLPWATSAVVLNTWHTMFTELTVTTISTSTGTGTFKGWIDNEPVFSKAVTPIMSSGTSITRMDRTSIGAQLAGTSEAAFFKGIVGRCGKIAKALSDAERTLLRDWMLGTKYVAP